MGPRRGEKAMDDDRIQFFDDDGEEIDPDLCAVISRKRWPDLRNPLPLKWIGQHDRAKIRHRQEMRMRTHMTG